MTKEYSFSVLWGDHFARSDEDRLVYADNEAARKARDDCAKLAIQRGFKVRRSTLAGQLRQYWGWQKPCGMICNVYKLRIEEPARTATNRPGDMAAAYAEETGLDYATALVHCNMD